MLKSALPILCPSSEITVTPSGTSIIVGFAGSAIKQNNLESPPFSLANRFVGNFLVMFFKVASVQINSISCYKARHEMYQVPTFFANYNNISTVTSSSTTLWNPSSACTTFNMYPQAIIKVGNVFSNLKKIEIQNC